MIALSKKEINKLNKILGSNQKKLPMILARAYNRSSAKFRTEINKKTREEYTIKSKAINSTITIKKATKTNLGTVIKSKGGMEPLTNYKVSPSKANPSSPPKFFKAAVKKDGLKIVPRAFMANYKGEEVAFQRAGTDRTPIDRLSGPAVPMILNNQDNIDHAYDEAKNMLYKRLDHEIKRVLEGK